MDETTRTFSQTWMVETLRVTGFPADLIKETDQQWWSLLTGEQPENRTQNPRMGTLHEHGTFKSGVLTLDIQPMRLDFLYTVGMQQPHDSSAETQTIGLLQDVIEDYRTMAIKLFKLEPFPVLQRLAFGAILFQPVNDRKEGYSKLPTYLKVPIDPEKSSDFFYQINRPRSSTIIPGEIILNRLSKWSVAAYEFVAVQIKPDLKAMPVASMRHAIRLESDINTSQDRRTPLNKDDLPAIFDELVDYALEISEKGDIP